MKKQTIVVDGINAEFKKRLDAWLAAHYRENLSAEQIARGMLMHRSWLHRHIKGATRNLGGLSVTKYLAHYRVERSIELFSTPKSLKEIAYAVGFNDYRYFARAFKARFGMAPGEMRKTQF